LIYKITKENNKKREGTKGKFGTVGAIAIASLLPPYVLVFLRFVSRFQPLKAVYIKEIWRQQRPEVQTFTEVTVEPFVRKFILHSLYFILQSLKVYPSGFFAVGVCPI
jgi:hypothetical protein